MKKIVIITLSILSLYACKVPKELYLIIDTRDTVNIKYKSFHYNKYVNNFGAEYFLFKDDPGKWYGGGVLLKYRPYKDSILKRWKNTKKLRTKNISISEWKQLKKNLIQEL